MDTKKAFLARSIAQRVAIVANLAALAGVVWFCMAQRRVDDREAAVAWGFAVLAVANLYGMLASGAPTLLLTLIKRRRLEEEAKVQALERAQT